MLFVSRIVFTMGAFFASTQHVLKRPDPGDHVDLIHQGPRALGLSTALQPPSTPILSVSSSVPLPGLARPRRLLRWGEILTNAITPAIHTGSTYPSYTNVTWTNYRFTERISTVPYYDGPKSLTLYDDRRALAVYASVPRDLAVYRHPSSVAIYTGPIDYIQFWPDLHSYWVLLSVYAPRFVSTPMFKDYVHLSQEDFDRWMEELILPGGSLDILSLLNPSAQYLTIGELVRGPAERASRAMAGLYVLGSLVALAVLLVEKYVELCETFSQDRNQPQSLANSFQTNLLKPIQYLSLVSAEPKISGEDAWWAVGGKETAQLGVPTIMLAHITSDPAPVNAKSHPESRPTRVRVVDRRRAFLHALANLKPSRNGGRWDLD
ncbi:unnamed protein product [Rhizoctonia solani]|uniref:Uncharacterized protein n=1 Tax=Rhizoctonia solani TaxID=456999 RepID=A0A8H2WYR3_9AGAM|nr:unnamed protein product [Rhizoctonia solani]